MTQAFLQTLMGRTITVALELAVPTLAVSLGVGLLVSVLQAVTQIQEMTLTFIPKVFAVGLTMVLLGPWMLDTMLAFTVEVFKQHPGHDCGLTLSPLDAFAGDQIATFFLALARVGGCSCLLRSSPHAPCPYAYGSVSPSRHRSSPCPPSSTAA